MKTFASFAVALFALGFCSAAIASPPVVRWTDEVSADSVAKDAASRLSIKQFRSFLSMVNLHLDEIASSELEAADRSQTVWKRMTVVAGKMPLVKQAVSLEVLRRRGGPAFLLMRDGGTALLKSMGQRNALVQFQGYDEVVPAAALKASYVGEAILLARSQEPDLQIDEPARVRTMDTVGGEVEIIEVVKLRNRGERSLNVKVKDTSCGCTSAALSSAQIFPGHSGTLTLKMRASGESLVTVNLEASDPSWPLPIVGLRIQPPKIKIIPPAPLVLNVQMGQSGEIGSLFSLPRSVGVRGASIKSRWLTAHWQKIGTRGDQIEYRVSVVISANAPEGHFKETIAVRLSHPSLRELLVFVSGFVNNDVMVRPPMLLLGTAPLHGLLKKTVIVNGPRERPFSIVGKKATTRDIVIKADPSVVTAAHAVEIDIPIAGSVGASIRERVTLGLSDGRQLDIDIIGSIIESTAPTSPLPQIGLPAPYFTAPDMDGKLWKLSEMKVQKNLLLTFFPKCFTGGCANHLSSLRDHQAEFEALNTQILAVSVDPSDGDKGQKAFAKQWGLNFPLIPDTTRKLSMLYGATRNRTDLDARMSILIDKQGIVRYIDTDVHVMTHGADMLAKMRELSFN